VATAETLVNVAARNLLVVVVDLLEVLAVVLILLVVLGRLEVVVLLLVVVVLLIALTFRVVRDLLAVVLALVVVLFLAAVGYLGDLAFLVVVALRLSDATGNLRRTAGLGEVAARSLGDTGAIVEVAMLVVVPFASSVPFTFIAVPLDAEGAAAP
jgi:hypothetical protein